MAVQQSEQAKHLQRERDVTLKGAASNLDAL